MSLALVTETQPWSFPDERTGEIRNGYSLFYLDAESPLIGNRKGFERLKISGSVQVVEAELREVPGWYELGFRQRPNRETGRAELVLSTMRYVGPLEVPQNGPVSMLRRVEPS